MDENRISLRLPLIVAAFCAAAALTAVVFSGWLNHGPAILLAMAESGLSWCF